VIGRLLPARLCIANFRSRLGGGDWFDDWVMGRQFVPDYLHHPVLEFKPSQAILSIGRQKGPRIGVAPSALYWEILGLFIDGEIGRPV
jgi:hypothetical protein